MLSERFIVSYNEGRRGFLKTSARFAEAAFATTQILPALDALENFLQPQLENTRTLENVVADMILYEETYGNAPLTFEAANAYIPLVAEFFAKGTDREDVFEELKDRTYPVRGDWQTQTRVSSYIPVIYRDPIRQIQEDYPLFNMTYEIATDIVVNLNWRALGYYYNHLGKFINIDIINNLFSASLQFREIDEQLDCQNTSPIVWFRNLLLHEMFHEISSRYVTPEEDVQLAAWEVAAQKPGFPANIDFDEDTLTVENYAFRVRINLHKSDDSDYYYSYFAFNEFATDYLTMQLVKNNGLSYTNATYIPPEDITNFERLLSQAGISYEDLLEMYTEGQIRRFLILIGRGAQREDLDPSLDFVDEEDLIRHAFSQTVGITQTQPLWKELQEYYTDIDPTRFRFSPNEQTNSCNVTIM